jgi:hypothetical protein
VGEYSSAATGGLKNRADQASGLGNENQQNRHYKKGAARLHPHSAPMPAEMIFIGKGQPTKLPLALSIYP